MHVIIGAFFRTKTIVKEKSKRQYKSHTFRATFKTQKKTKFKNFKTFRTKKTIVINLFMKKLL